MTTSNTSIIKLTFADLNDSQRQNLADKLLSDHPMRLQNTLVEYVLKKSWEDEEAPFCHDDIENFDYYGNVVINGSWEELTEEERDEKLTLQEYLADKAEAIFDKMEEYQLTIEDDQAYDDYQEKLDRMEEIKDKYRENADNLEGMDFDEQPEIMQWFSCTDWMIRELEKHGQCTLDGEFWGRQGWGQSVVLDHVIQRIAFDYACDYGKEYLTEDQL